MRRGVAQRTIWTAAGAVLVLVMLAPQSSAASGSLPNPLTFATQLLSQMMSLQTLFQHPMNSATLPQTRNLEQVLLSGSTTNIGSVQSNYGKVYGTLPASTAIQSDSRLAMDMSDAQAQAALKKAIALDAIAKSEEQISQQMMKLVSTPPGATSAVMISAQAAAWNLQAQGYTQGALAQLLRLESAPTAYSGYEMKHISASHQTANQNVQTILNQN